MRAAPQLRSSFAASSKQRRMTRSGHRNDDLGHSAKGANGVVPHSDTSRHPLSLPPEPESAPAALKIAVSGGAMPIDERRVGFRVRLRCISILLLATLRQPPRLADERGEARGPLDVMNTGYPRIRMRV
jgi:hypothetical protein